MLSQLVGLCLEIAMLIYEDKSTTGLGVNEISRRTSSRDKPRIIRAIRYLEGAALIETRTSPTHEQKKIKILTTLGYEFTQLIKSINDYMSCYDKFEAKVRAYYDIHENIGYDILINKLRNKGYSQEESASYSRWFQDVKRIELEAPFSFIQTLLAKYAIVLSKFDLNDYARAILSNLVTDRLDKALSTRCFLVDNDYPEGGEKIRQEHIAKLATQAYIFPRIYKMTFEGDEFSDRHDRFVKEEVSDLAHSMMNLLRPNSEIIGPDFVEDLEGFVDHHELEKIKNRNIGEKWTERTRISLKNQLELDAKQLGANTTMDVSINGKTSYHKADLIVETSEKSYVIVFEYLNFFVLPEYIFRWIFNAVDIIREKNQKVIFVYLGHIRNKAVEALRHYYDAVVHFDEFRDYLSEELGY